MSAPEVNTPPTEVCGMTPELRDAWIDALRSGDYKQASGRLETPEGFCCMGVLAKVVGVQPDPTSGDMQTFYVMTRKGQFRTAYYTQNQCKVEGHRQYTYHLRFVFDGSAKLDENNFLIDHADIDRAIQGLELAGSCEEMHKQISKKLVPMLERKKLPLLACKCTIYPEQYAVAFLEFITLKAPEYAPCLSLT